MVNFSFVKSLHRLTSILRASIWKKKKEARLADSWLSCGCLQIMWFSWVQAINRLYEGRSDKRNVEIATIIALLLPPAPNLQFHFSNQNKFPMISWLRILISKGRSVSCNIERNKGPRHWPLQESQTKTPSTFNQPVMILYFAIR